MFILLDATGMAAESFPVQVSAGWRVRIGNLNGALAGQKMTIIEPGNGGEERCEAARADNDNSGGR